MIFSLEFNEEKQAFHHNINHVKRPDENGWVTIIDSIDDKNWHILESFVNRIDGRIHTIASLKQDVKELKGFFDALTDDYRYTVKIER